MRALRILGLAVLVGVVVWLLFAIVFPWVDQAFVTDPVMG